MLSLSGISAVHLPIDMLEIGRSCLIMTARVASVLGGPALRAILVALTAATLLRRRQRQAAVLLVLAVGGTGAVNTAVKRVVGRARPGGGKAEGESFPSGHASGTLAFIGVTSFLVHRITGDRLLSLAMTVAGVPLTAFVGLSRVILREHYPGDVVGGYALGACWLGLILWVPRRMLQSPEEDRSARQ